MGAIIPANAEPMDVVVAYDYAHVNGGAAKVAIAGACGLAAKGHHVRFFAPVGPADPSLAAAGVEATALRQADLIGEANRLKAARNGIWNVAAARALKRLLATVDPTRGVVLQHGWAKAMSPACERVIAGSGLPSVYYMHEYFAACPNGAFFDFGAGENCTRRPMSLSCLTANCDARNYGHKLYRVARHAAFSGPGRLRKNLARTVYISGTQLDAMRPYLPADGQTQFAPNPVDVVNVGPAVIADDAPFLFAGRFSREKGPLIAAEAAAAASADIAFVGAGELEPDLRQASPDATFQGWRDSQGVAAAMRASRALVFPSLWLECQPLIVLEAMAHGLPAMVSSTSAAAEFVVDGETGLHVPPGDIPAWTAAFRRLEDVDEARRMGREAHRRYWAAPHTIERHLDVIEPVLRAAIEERPAG